MKVLQQTKTQKCFFQNKKQEENYTKQLHKQGYNVKSRQQLSIKTYNSIVEYEKVDNLEEIWITKNTEE